MKYEDAIKPFELGDGEEYVLLLHGYSSNPYEHRLFAEYLADRGFHVIVPLYPGHGEDRFSLAKTTRLDWITSVDQVLVDIKSRNPSHIFVSGQSMGGLITLHVGINHPEISALAPIAAPVFIKKKLLALLPIVKPFMTYFPITEPIDALDPAVINDPIFKETQKRYDKTAIPALVELLRLMKEVKGKLNFIKQPTLVVQAKQDKSVHPSNAEYIFDHIGTASENKRLLWLENSGHVATMDYDRNKVFFEVSDFFTGFLNVIKMNE